MLCPFAGDVGLPVIWAAVVMNIFGHGIGLSYDFVIQGAPSITAAAAGIDVNEVIKASIPFARKNLVPVLCGFAATIVALFLV